MKFLINFCKNMAPHCSIYLFCGMIYQAIFEYQVTHGFFVYTGEASKGDFSQLPLNECSNLPSYLAGKINSIHTQDTCARLYDRKDCTGHSIELTSASPYHWKLEYWRFANRTVSVSPCRGICSRELAFPAEAKPVEIFSEEDFEGDSISIQINNCTEIPVEYANHTASIITHRQCIQIYDNVDCKPFGAGKHSWVEIRPDAEFLQDFKIWGFKHEAKAVSYCGYNCGGIAPEIPDIDRHATTSAPLSAGTIVAIVAVPLLVVLVCVPLVYCVLRKFFPRKFGNGAISEKEIEEFHDGMGIDIERESSGGGAVNAYSVELLAQARPYNATVEIKRNQIKFDERAPLGTGEFGVVYKGIVELPEWQGGISGCGRTSVPVAIKTVKPGTGPDCLRSIMKEVKVMLYLGKNAYIAEMIGCCSENLRNGEILVLMEYCSNGNLESFLRKSQPNFGNILDQGQPNHTENQKGNKSQNYLSCEEKPVTFDFYQLLKWCIEVARGMEFLALSRVIHSDLAARNVLLTHNLQAKISDFGLSRQLYSYSQYVKKHQEPLPWRWMAIESLKRLEFSTESDVWSYGIFCWEVFTLGEKPYQGLVWTDDFATKLVNGLRPSKPIYATTECYDVMSRCWDVEPKARPTFTQIIEELTAAFSRNRL